MTQPRPQRRAAPATLTDAQLVEQGTAALRATPPEDIAALFEPEPRQRRAPRDRTREDGNGASLNQQIRAVFASDWFWDVAACLPFNNLDTQQFGRRRDYPSWLLFGLAYVVAGIQHLATRQAVATHLADPREWAAFAEWVDQYVEDGWTKISDLDHTNRTRRPRRPQAVAMTAITSRVRPRRRNQRGQHARPVRPALRCVAPRRHHLNYFNELVTGNSHKVRIDHASVWWQMPLRVVEVFRKVSIEQAQAMGLYSSNRPFQFINPDPTQYLLFDGTVFGMNRARPDSLSEDHTVGGNTRHPIYGSKWTIASHRIVGQYQSRLYFEAAHTGHNARSAYRDESQAVCGMAPHLRDLSGGGIKGIIVDSAVRGRAVVDLQHNHGLVVVNYPHAETNPDGGAGRRLNATRRERSHLRTIARNTANGPDCRHLIYALGGKLVEQVRTSDGTHTQRNCDVTGYQARPNAGGGQREYLMVRMTCEHSTTPWTARVALFHTDPVTPANGGTSDPNYNWGEVVRVFAPGTERFQRLYDIRNDTESRHADLKARVKHLPRDINAQQMRLYGAMLAANTLAWQVHLQAHGQGNVLDDTA